MGPFLKSAAQEHRHLAKAVRGWYFSSPFVMLTLHQGSQTLGQDFSLQLNFSFGCNIFERQSIALIFNKSIVNVQLPPKENTTWLVVV